MINIINTYLDQSFETLIKRFDHLTSFRHIFKKDITIREIFILCIRDGYVGFNLHTDQQTFINAIKTMIKNENLDDSIDIIQSKSSVLFLLNKTIFPSARFNQHTTIQLNAIPFCWNKVPIKII